ncbi:MULTISPECIES: hypothetical protein [Niallia]|uniref:Uncharacterized protein n=1 Tax=Niallia alba TaxID=2729105 RepID=A0A7Y0K6V5_9BACI|nr:MULTISPECIES: hypothetical protein [Niallia]NMO76887.1 hypothetical protein [Niallia alba]UTI40090.1 hypothetical protein NKG37_14150 [Niallia sp. RD1]
MKAEIIRKAVKKEQSSKRNLLLKRLFSQKFVAPIFLLILFSIEKATILWKTAIKNKRLAGEL